ERARLAARRGRRRVVLNTEGGPVRVLFFVSEYDRFHGGQRSLLQLVQNLPPAGVEPVVAFPGRGRCTEAYEAAGVRVEIVPGPEELHAFGQDLLRISAWRKLNTVVTRIIPYS